MASPHRISTPIVPGGPLNFEFWNGEQPPVIHEQVVSFTKPGANGVGQQKVGRHHPAIQSTLTSIWPDYANAIAALAVYRQVPGSGLCDVVYNFVSWSAFSIGFYVDAVELVECQRRPLWVGPDFTYYGAGELVTRWTLTPVEVS